MILPAQRSSDRGRAPVSAARHAMVRLVLASAAGWGGATGSRAADDPSSIAATPAVTVEATRETSQALKDLELLKRGLAPEGQRNGQGARNVIGTAPDVSTVAAPPVAVTPREREAELSRDQRRQAWAQRNWLVEGVRQAGRPVGQTTVGTTGATSAALDPGSDNEAGGTGENWLLAAVDAQSETMTPRGAETALAPETASKSDDALLASGANPLAEFMRDWIRPEDQALLGTLGGEGALDAGFSGSVGPADGPRRQTAARLEDVRGGVAAIAPGSNPYLRGTDELARDLAAWRAPGGGAGTAAAVVRPPPAPLPTSPGAPSAVAPSAEQTRGDREPWKPPVREDEKYFPRLKRF